MLFYTMLFVTGLVLILVVHWACRMVASLVHKTHRHRINHAKQNPTAHLNEERYGKNTNLASQAWGRKPHSTPANLARTHPAQPTEPAPWKWPGNENEMRAHHPQSSTSGGANLNPSQMQSKRNKGVSKGRRSGLSSSSSNSRYELSGRPYTPNRDPRSPPAPLASGIGRPGNRVGAQITDATEC